MDEKEAQESRKNEQEGKSNASIGRLLSLVKPEVNILVFAMIALFITSLSEVSFSCWADDIDLDKSQSEAQ